MAISLAKGLDGDFTVLYRTDTSGFCELNTEGSTVNLSLFGSLNCLFLVEEEIELFNEKNEVSFTSLDVVRLSWLGGIIFCFLFEYLSSKSLKSLFLKTLFVSCSIGAKTDWLNVVALSNTFT
eukprot:NODE_95_length_21460_cov_0.300220.p17 type:complete len:123 gc:universal NODE_95_length_21460_cov_0.300220:2616-2984(+)